jgi:hypothetical protein
MHNVDRKIKSEERWDYFIICERNRLGVVNHHKL